MDFAPSPKAVAIRDEVEQFFHDHILPHDPAWQRWADAPESPEPPFMAELKHLAYERGLWNMALPRLSADEPGTQLTNLEFAYVAEILGRLPWASEVFNCHAPDVPNMEILQMFGTETQKEHYLNPLLQATTRSSFAMTEPGVGSSDATNISTRITRDGDDYVINGHKWFASGAGNPNCSFLIVVGVTHPEAARGQQHSMVIVPKDTSGVEVLRTLPVLHHVDVTAPHTELRLTDVRVPAENLLGEEGAGFVIGQSRLGPARVHHCMRAIGRCEVLLRLMVERAATRQTFGNPLQAYSNIQDAIAQSRIELEQARLLVQKTAWLLDTVGNREARKEISLIKVAVAQAYHNIANRGIQIFGAMGMTNDAPFAAALAQARAFRIYDGPDEVHWRTIFRLEAREATAAEHRYSDYYLRRDANGERRD